MIWFRRTLAIPAIITFIILLVAVLLITQVNDTAGNPGFYVDRLREADMYNFLYQEVVPAGLEELEKQDTSDIPIDIDALKDEAVSTAESILPPEWLQAQVESAIHTVLPYILGDTDGFTYTLALKDRVERTADVIKNETLQSEAFASLYDDGFSYLAEQLAKNLDALPYTLTISEQQIENALKTVASENWIVSRAGAAIDAITPYMTGDSEHFTVTIPLEDRVDAIAAAFLELIGGPETYDYLLDEIISPVVASSLQEAVNLPFGVTVTQEEIASAIKQVLPQAWVQARLEEVVNGIAAYIKAEADTIVVTIDLSDRKAAAVDALAGLADQKLSDLYNSIPTCSTLEFLVALLNRPEGSLPSCRPEGIAYEDFKGLLDIVVPITVEQMIGDQIPDQWVLTDSDIIALLGEGNADVLDKMRDRVLEGWKFTDADLIDLLGSDAEQTLYDARDRIANGYTVTETDITDAIKDADINIDLFDDVRHSLGTARTWLWAIWLAPILVLLYVGLLGGRNWRSRLAWALVPLFLTSLTVFVAVAVSYPSLGEPRLEEALVQPSEFEGFKATMVEKGNEVLVDVVNSFLSGIQTKTVYMMIGSGVILLGIVILTVVRSRREPVIAVPTVTGAPPP